MTYLKPCRVCNIRKPIGSFYKRIDSISGVRNECKDCSEKRKAAHGRTKRGLIVRMFADQNRTSRNMGFGKTDYTKDEFVKWLTNQSEFHRIHKEWVGSGFDKWLIPSCDRINDYKNYSFDNIKVVTWRENFEKAQRDIKNGINNKKSKSVTCIDLNTKKTTVYPSVSIAARELGISRASASHCCNNYYIDGIVFGRYKLFFNE